MSSLREHAVARHSPATRTFRGLTALLAAGAMLATACGSGDLPEAQQTTQSTPSPAPLPSVTQAAPAPVAAPITIEVEPNVVLKDPAIEVVPPSGAEGDLWAALTADGVDTLTAMRLFDAKIVTVDEDRDVIVAAVDPAAFRPFTPESTAQAPQVWERLLAGDILVRHDVAHALGLELGGTTLLLTEFGAVNLRIGAFASNGAPPIADVVVPWDVGRQLGHENVTRLLVAVQEGASTSRVQTAVVEALGGGTASRRQKPQSQQAQLFASTGNLQIPAFTYRDNGDGTIAIDPAWVGEWIVGVDLPLLGRAYVNKVMAPQLLAAFRDVESAGLLEHFDRGQFGGGWVARHIDWNPRKSLSMHAWGLAIDINTRDNALGATPQMDRRIVEIFDRWGFSWGGRWSRPDGMHFELAQVVTAS